MEIREQLRSELKKFRLQKIEPFACEDDQKGHFRREIFSELGELGFCGLPITEEYGGAGLSLGDYCALLQEIAHSSVAHAVTLSVSTMVQGMIEQFGSEAQKSSYLPPLTSGREIAAFCLSESGSGSDAASLQTNARRGPRGDYLLNGRKMWISSAGLAKTYVVMARTGGEGARGISAFIVDGDNPGLSVGKRESKMGWRASPTCEMVFEDCKVSEEDRLGAEGEGFKVAMAALDKGRITIAAIAIGLAQRALEEAARYALGRKQFKQNLFEFQGIQFMLADMATEIEAAHALAVRAAELYDRGRPSIKCSSMAKLKATDVCMRVTTDAVQILGGVGYTAEYPVERFMRDAKALQIVEGANQIQRVVIGRELKREYFVG